MTCSDDIQMQCMRYWRDCWNHHIGFSSAFLLADCWSDKKWSDGKWHSLRAFPGITKRHQSVVPIFFQKKLIIPWHLMAHPWSSPQVLTLHAGAPDNTLYCVSLLCNYLGSKWFMFWFGRNSACSLPTSGESDGSWFIERTSPAVLNLGEFGTESFIFIQFLGRCLSASLKSVQTLGATIQQRACMIFFGWFGWFLIPTWI